MRYLVRSIVSALRLLPFSWLMALGRAVGFLAWYVAPERRRVAIKNAEIIGVKDPVKTAKLSFQHTMMSYLESISGRKVDEEFVRVHVRIEGLEHVQEIISARQPHFFTSAHIGGWEIASPIWAHLNNSDVAAIARTPRSKALATLIDTVRVGYRVQMLPHRNIADKVTALINDAIPVGSLLDHNASMKDCIMVPFFGMQVPFIAGVPAIAARKNLPVIPLFVLREKGGYLLKCYPPLYPDKSLKPKERIAELAQMINKVYEDVIKAYPEQWYLIHKRFKNVVLKENDSPINIYRS